MRNFILLSAISLAPALARAQSSVTISGTVQDELGPIGGALVCGIDWDNYGRVALPIDACALTGADGSFSVQSTRVSDGTSLVAQITAASPGYITTDVFVPAGDPSGVSMTLVPTATPDNPDYVWWSPSQCAQCHTTLTQQWNMSQHALAGVDPFVQQLYSGTDAQGRPNVPPGYKLEHDDAGVCGACHAATASWSAGESVPLDDLPAEHRHGVSCEACHKIADVTPGAGPGVSGAVTLWRPPPSLAQGGQYFQFAFGPYPNVIGHAMVTSYSPLFSSARLCSGCHDYTNEQGVVVMDTYTDWLSVGDPETSLQCQDCHMKWQYGTPAPDSMDEGWVVDGDHLRQMAAQHRDPETIFTHSFYGGKTLAPHALEVALEAEQDGDELVVRAAVTNVGANHRIPTGMAFRELILVVRASDAGGEQLEQLAGPTLGPRAGSLAGGAGKIFGRVLADAGGAPTFEFWDAASTTEDTRLAPGATDASELRFAVKEEGSVNVEASIIYRRFSAELAAAKGWDTDDQVAASTSQAVDVASGCSCRGTGGAALWPALACAVALARLYRRRL